MLNFVSQHHYPDGLFYTIMARPVKNYCDYFTHDNNMRNHRKVKAIRTKFHAVGYAIWNMFLEYLTGADGNVFEFSDIELELLSGDFGVSVTEIRDVLNYCIKLELLFMDDGFVYSETLDERLKPVYEKRKVNKESSVKQKRKNGKFDSNTVNYGVSDNNNLITVTEMPQMKRNEIKLNNLIPLMVKNWMDKNPNYFKDEVSDSTACLEISYKIAQMKGWDKKDVIGAKRDDVIFEWVKIIDFVLTDNFLKSLALKNINNQFQMVIQKINNPIETTKPQPKKMVM